MRLQEQALEKENLALQQKTLQMHRLFIRSVCHEVRSPLSVVLNGIYMFEVLCRRHEDMLIDDTLLDIQSSCQSAVDLMESLLVYEQLESQTLKLKPEEMELAEFVESNLAGFIPLAKQWDVSLSYMVKLQGRAFVNASRTELGLTVRALVDNAMKYTPPGGRVEVNLYECEKLDSTDWIRVEVTDTGPGLSAEKVQSLFEHIQKFTPTTNNTEQGRGVAIYVIHGIVKLHGGKVGVASPGLGLGSSYFIDIPISRVEYGGVSLKDSKMIRGGSLLHQGTDMSAIKRREKSLIFIADISKSAEQLPATKQTRLSDTNFLIPGM
jgi:signal transduction histidine kinase